MIPCEPPVAVPLEGARLEDVYKIYPMGREEVRALAGVSAVFRRGEFCAILGASGSGKSTLLNLLGCLDRPTRGRYLLAGQDVSAMTDDQLSDFRLRHLGFIFQSFNLIPQSTVEENIQLPLYYQGVPARAGMQRARELAARVGLESRLRHKPSELSGGQQQRVAIARALANDPAVLLADEPTGNLDSHTGREIMDLLAELNGHGLTIIMVTHEVNTAAYASRRLYMKDGLIERVEGGFAMITLRGVNEIGVGIKSLLQHKLRSALTLLGLVFGVGSVIAMLAVGEGASTQVLEQIRKLGSHNILVDSVKPVEESSSHGQAGHVSIYGLTYEDSRRFRETIPGVSRMVPVKLLRQQGQLGSCTMDLRIVGTTPDWFELVRRPVVAGRVLTGLDLDRHSDVVVLTEHGARRLLATRETIGQPVRIGGTFFTVVGIVRSENVKGGSVPLPDREVDAYIPLSVSRARFGDIAMQGGGGSPVWERIELNQIIIEAASMQQVEPTAAAIEYGLKRFHEQGDYRMNVPLALLRQAEATKRTFNIVLGSIAGISLLVGGIGIMNIMLATVVERTREIGIRRAIGARRSQIIRQFLIETVVLSSIGGLLGIIIGVFIPQIITRFAGMPTQITPESVVLSLGISAGIGVLFGLYPAVRAARLDPIVALRHE